MSRLLVLLLLAAAPVLSPSASAAQTAASLRPQQPTRPFPYREEEVSYLNPRAPGVTLAGTLTIPPGNGPFPAVLLKTNKTGAKPLSPSPSTRAATSPRVTRELEPDNRGCRLATKDCAGALSGWGMQP